MNEQKKCKECGDLLPFGVNTCTNCGCPVSDAEPPQDNADEEELSDVFMGMEMDMDMDILNSERNTKAEADGKKYAGLCYKWLKAALGIALGLGILSSIGGAAGVGVSSHSAPLGILFFFFLLALVLLWWFVMFIFLKAGYSLYMLQVSISATLKRVELLLRKSLKQ